ncbi:ankyrin repeat protein [Seminavis robusta]|uniref:Ankyrin repeat protein n=1 Tax=Seminavis robusta TaxID=568900 RepID=A0A9N8H3Z9_9STRA|nr:ankyrin repeat protein [Seminavis robusta]|eukprot:Sro73_g040190.1 ankyrin repeat protein (167) ;mRNA; f:6750-7506
MNRLYEEYCKVELKKNPRKVKDNPDAHEWDCRSAKITNILQSETFCNLPSADYWLGDNFRNKKPSRLHVCNAIAAVGNIMVMQWARQQGFPWNERTCAYAAKNGHLEMLQWLREHGYTCSYAAKAGHLEILQWARNNGCRWDDMTSSRPAENGHLEVIKWSCENEI